MSSDNPSSQHSSGSDRRSERDTSSAEADAWRKDRLSDAAWKQKQSQRIFQFRSQTGLTQKEFAALMGWSTSQQSQIEQNADSVRIRPMHVMAARFAAEKPLEALRMARDLSERARQKLQSYAERLEDFGMP